MSCNLHIFVLWQSAKPQIIQFVMTWRKWEAGVFRSHHIESVKHVNISLKNPEWTWAITFFLGLLLISSIWSYFLFCHAKKKKGFSGETLLKLSANSTRFGNRWRRQHPLLSLYHTSKGWSVWGYQYECCLFLSALCSPGCVSQVRCERRQRFQLLFLPASSSLKCDPVRDSEAVILAALRLCTGSESLMRKPVCVFPLCQRMTCWIVTDKMCVCRSAGGLGCVCLTQRRTAAPTWRTLRSSKNFSRTNMRRKSGENFGLIFCITY